MLQNFVILVVIATIIFALSYFGSDKPDEFDADPEPKDGIPVKEVLYTPMFDKNEPDVVVTRHFSNPEVEEMLANQPVKQTVSDEPVIKVRKPRVAKPKAESSDNTKIKKAIVKPTSKSVTEPKIVKPRQPRKPRETN